MGQVSSPWGLLPDGWKLSTIKKEMIVVTDYVANGSFASLAENVQYSNTEEYAILIRLYDYNNNFSGSFVYVNEHAYNFLSKSKLYGDEIIISNVGANVGTVFKCPRLSKPMTLGPNSIVVKLNGNNDFYFYWFKSRYGKYCLDSIVSGSAQPKFNKTHFKELPIPVPPLVEQEKIASLLSSIDDKIAVNSRICANLEAQAEALFKSWFVDFTPFKDQPFVDSELGPIPQGWKVRKYEDIILDTLAGDWGKEKITGNYTHEVACVRGCDFQDMNNGYRGNTPQRYILEKNYSTKRLLPQDLIIEISGGTLTVSTGRACLVSKEMLEKYDNNLVCTNFCKVIRPIDGYSAYCYYSWLHKYNNRVMFGYENGSSGLKNFRFKDFLTKEPLLIPPKADLIKFQHIIKLLQQKKQTNGTESTKLAALRDTLLPKLMSGEIKL